MLSRVNQFFHLSKQKLFVLSLLVGLLGVASFGGVRADATGTDCDNNAVIYCGFSSPANFIAKVRGGASGNDHNDLHAIYAHYNLATANYDNFIANAQPGVAYKNGEIKVNGQVVVTGAKSVGRIASYHGSGYFSMPIAGGPTLYGNVVAKTFASDALPVTVLFDQHGEVLFAVINSCGNPIYGEDVIPGATCDVLNKTPVSGKPNTYDFTSRASATNNASIASYTYDFGDGSKPEVRTNPNDVVEHTYTIAGTFTASVTVAINLPGNNHITVTSLPCKKTIQVVLPYAKCDQLTGAILDQSKHYYSFVAKANYGNGAAFTSADFTYGDGTSDKGVKPNLADNTATTTHTYAAAGNYSVLATLHFTANGAVTSVTCSAGVSPTQAPTPECKPGVPVGNPMCTPCQYNSAIPASDTAHCVAPATTLPNTGAGDVIAIFGAVAVAGFLFFRQFIYKRHAMAGNAAAMNLDHQILTAHHHANHATTHTGEHHQAHHQNHQTTYPSGTHPNASGAVAHPTYSKPNRLRPRKK